MTGVALFTGILDGRLDRRGYLWNFALAAPMLGAFLAMVLLGASDLVGEAVGRALEFLAFCLGGVWVFVAINLLLQRGRDAGLPSLATLAILYGGVSLAPFDFALWVGLGLCALALVPPSDFLRRGRA
ncbi:MAG: hypothetical protein AAF713_13935 [Pseudomonadota bacterium]